MTSDVSLPPAAVARYNAIKLAIIRDECEKSFEFFARYFFKVQHGTKLVMAEHLQILVDDLEDLFYGRIQNLLVNMPPRYGKTALCVILFCAWCYMKNPGCNTIHTSYADSLATENSSAIREIVRSAEFAALWPNIALTAHKNGKSAWATTKGGSFLAVSHGGQVTGFGAGRTDEWDGHRFKFSGLMLIDDPVKPDDYSSVPLRDGANKRWTQTLQSRRNTSRTPTLVIMQRIGKLDFTDMLLNDDAFTAPDGDASRFRHRKMAALIDEGLPTERALWPAKHTVAQLKVMRDQKNKRGEASPLAVETFTAQYQQEPTEAGGAIIKRHWFQQYADRDEVLKLCTMFIGVGDTAYTEDERNDPTSLQVWGFQGRRAIYLIDRLHGWWEFDKLLDRAATLAGRWPKARRWYIENKASGISLAQQMRKLEGMKGRKVILWKPKDYWWPEDKVARNRSWARQVHAGVVWVPSENTEDASYQPWVADFLDECSEFNADMTHAHDDDGDAGNMACSVWVRSGGGVRGLTEASNEGTVEAATS